MFVSNRTCFPVLATAAVRVTQREKEMEQNNKGREQVIVVIQDVQEKKE